MSKVWQGIIWVGHRVEARGDDKSEAIEHMYDQIERECPNCVEHADMDEITDVEMIDSPFMRRMGVVRHG